MRAILIDTSSHTSSAFLLQWPDNCLVKSRRSYNLATSLSSSRSRLRQIGRNFSPHLSVGRKGPIMSREMIYDFLPCLLRFPISTAGCVPFPRCAARVYLTFYPRLEAGIRPIYKSLSQRTDIRAALLVIRSYQ